MRGKYLIILLLLGIGAGALGYYYYQRNSYSKEILKLEILGPETVEMGEEIDYLVKYKNNGDFILEEPRLIFEYPQYSVIEEDKTQRQEMPLDDIYPGAENAIHFKARLLGKENEAKMAKVWLSYKLKNLEARFESPTTFTTVINRVPLTLEFDLPSRIESNKDFLFRLNYFSNVNYPLSGLRIFVEYPFGFEFKESSPRSLEKTEWELPILNKTEGGRIEITGKVSGEPGDHKIFRAKIGIWQEGEFILLKETNRGLEIVQPSVFISWQINNSPQYNANAGEYLHYEIFFKNTGEKTLENLFLVAELDAQTLNLETVQASEGIIQSGSRTIIWDHTRIPQLRYLQQMEEGKVDFWVKVKDVLATKNPLIRTKISLSQAKEEIVTKINSKLVINQTGYFQTGPFQNVGPLPPQVGQTTIYTIFWEAQNFYNDVRNLKVRAKLPSQVRLTGEFLPKETKISFDQVSREIIWDIGDLPGAISSESKVGMFFQVALVPDYSQTGQAAFLVSEATLSGEDSWTESIIEARAAAIDTTLPAENLGEEQGKVQ